MCRNIKKESNENIHMIAVRATKETLHELKDQIAEIEAMGSDGNAMGRR